MTGGVRMAGVGGVGGGDECDSGGVVGGDSCERGTEGGVAFEVPEELDLVGAVGCGGISVFGAKVNNLLAAVIPEGYVE
jgi:hypothetical protein